MGTALHINHPPAHLDNDINQDICSPDIVQRLQILIKSSSIRVWSGHLSSHRTVCHFYHHFAIFPFPDFILSDGQSPSSSPFVRLNHFTSQSRPRGGCNSV